HRDQLGHRCHYGDAGSLGSQFSPVDSGMLPERADGRFAIPANFELHRGLTLERIQDRVSLLERLEPQEPPKPLTAHAVNLLRRFVARAFNLNADPLDLRRRYGDQGMGQEAILARRLAESGVPFTLVNFALVQVKGQDWDTHDDNFKLMKDTLLPPMDRAVT